MVAFALRADGWWLRSEIIWAKPNPMPESVTDRPTKSHEQIFLLTKAERYYYDQEAVRGPAEYGENRATFRGGGAYVHNRSFDNSCLRETDGEVNDRPGTTSRNARSVWTIATEPYANAHFACVDSETECLTQGGWKRHADLVDGEYIASLDPTTRKLRWKPLLAIARYDVKDQLMVYARTSSLDMVLTPNHRCLVERRKLGGGYSPVHVKRADELIATDFTPTAAEWDDEGYAFDPAWAELLGWYIAEGHAIRGSIDVEISQSLSANAPKVARLRELLCGVDADFSEASALRDWRGRDAIQCWFRVRGYTAARLRELAPRKELTPVVLTWNTIARKCGTRSSSGRRCTTPG